LVERVNSSPAGIIPVRSHVPTPGTAQRMVSRAVFRRWTGTDAEDVEIVDYH
jgi:hypothetical protein